MGQWCQYVLCYLNFTKHLYYLFFITYGCPLSSTGFPTPTLYDNATPPHASSQPSPPPSYADPNPTFDALPSTQPPPDLPPSDSHPVSQSPNSPSALPGAGPSALPQALPETETTFLPTISTRARRVRKANVLSLNMCTCGVVITESEINAGTDVMRCRVPGCETVWVSIFLVSLFHLLTHTIYSDSIIERAWITSSCPRIGPVKVVQSIGVVDCSSSPYVRAMSWPLTLIQLYNSSKTCTRDLDIPYLERGGGEGPEKSRKKKNRHDVKFSGPATPLQRLHGKLLHAALVIPAGRAYLTGLEAMLASFNDNPFIPHTPPRDTPEDLEWWKRQLSHLHISIPIRAPQPLVDYQACSDASTSFGVAISIGPKWRAWKFVAGWKSQGRDIQWAEAIGFELLVISLCDIAGKGEHIRVDGDNRGVVEGWWKRSSANKPTNRVFRRILALSQSRDRTIHTRYVPSEHNPADAPSRGKFPPRHLLLDDVLIPLEVKPFLIGVESLFARENSCHQVSGART